MTAHIEWSPEQITCIQEGYAEGRPVWRIAMDLGLKISTVSAMAGRIGLKHPSKAIINRPLGFERRWWRNQHFSPEPPTLPYVPGIIVSGRYVMRQA